MEIFFLSRIIALISIIQFKEVLECKPGMRIRIRSDPLIFGLPDPNLDPRKKISDPHSLWKLDRRGTDSTWIPCVFIRIYISRRWNPWLTVLVPSPGIWNVVVRRGGSCKRRRRILLVGVLWFFLRLQLINLCMSILKFVQTSNIRYFKIIISCLSSLEDNLFPFFYSLLGIIVKGKEGYWKDISSPNPSFPFPIPFHSFPLDSLPHRLDGLP